MTTLRIKEIGFYPKVLDSFLLVNRIGENDKSVIIENKSPSRFKGAPGVSLMGVWGAKRVRGGLEPSIGINVSYIDFDTTKDLELGVGGIVGLFRNQILLNFGQNLHTDRYSWYWSIGLSFTNLANKIKEWGRSGQSSTN